MLNVDISLRRERFNLQLSHQFAADKVTAIFGVSGGGKSSLLRCIAGLEPAVEGTINWGNETWLSPTVSVKPQQRRIGMVFQHSHLFTRQRVINNIYYGLPKLPSEAFISPERVIELLQLESLLQQYPSQLSGGQQRRVALARALLSQPRLLLLDEPMTGLDNEAKQQILVDLKRVQQELQLPMLMVSHHIDEIIPLADDVLIFQEGKKLASGALVEQAHHLGAAADGPLSILEIRRASSEPIDGLQCWHLGEQPLWLPQRQSTLSVTDFPSQQRLLVWARDVSLAREPLTETSLSNQVQATVVDIQSAPHPAERVVVLMVNGQSLRALVTKTSCQRLDLFKGQQLTAAFKAAAMH